MLGLTRAIIVGAPTRAHALGIGPGPPRSSICGRQIALRLVHGCLVADFGLTRCTCTLLLGVDMLHMAVAEDVLPLPLSPFHFQDYRLHDCIQFNHMNKEKSPNTGARANNTLPHSHIPLIASTVRTTSFPTPSHTFTCTKKQSPNTGARASNTLHYSHTPIALIHSTTNFPTTSY